MITTLAQGIVAAVFWIGIGYLIRLAADHIE